MLTTQLSNDTVQDINWQAVFNHACDHSIVFEAGDSLPHGKVVSSAQAVANVGDNGAAGLAIQQATANHQLKETEAGYDIVRDGPGTGELRQTLASHLENALDQEENVVIQSPTSSGKTYTPSTTRWRDHSDVTGGQPVVLFSATKDARDDALAASRDSHVSAEILYGRTDSCPLARGDYDSDNDQGNASISAPDGGEPSVWFKTMCEDKGMPVSVAHGDFNHQHSGDLPCCDDGKCQSAMQWSDIPYDDQGDFNYDILHATHPFARVPQLIEDCNILIDELPDFTLNMTTKRLRDTVSSYLETIDAPLTTWEDLLARVTGPVNADLSQLLDTLETPEIDWFRNNSDAHVLTPGIVEAIITAEQRGHGRWVGDVRYSYPSLIPNQDESDQEVILRIVLDDSNDLMELQVVPDFSKARSVIGLDAHPTLPKWRANTVMSIEANQIADDDELQKWRQNGRNLNIIQVERNTNPWTNQYFNEEKVGVLCGDLRREHGAQFNTGITSNAYEEDLQHCLIEAGIESPETIHFGNEKSRNSFDSEQIGLVAGCISLSSEKIKDWLAVLDKDATPERELTDDHCRGQKWKGPDADTAEDLLAEVRENGVLQACGRYARSPQDPDDGATVYVLTDVLPDEYVDEVIEKIDVFGGKEQQVLNCIVGSTGKTATEIAEQTEAGKRHVWKTLNKVKNRPWIMIDENAGSYNSDVYQADWVPSGVVER